MARPGEGLPWPFARRIYPKASRRFLVKGSALSDERALFVLSEQIAVSGCLRRRVQGINLIAVKALEARPAVGCRHRLHSFCCSAGIGWRPWIISLFLLTTSEWN